MLMFRRAMLELTGLIWHCLSLLVLKFGKKKAAWLLYVCRDMSRLIQGAPSVLKQESPRYLTCLESILTVAGMGHYHQWGLRAKPPWHMWRSLCLGHRSYSAEVNDFVKKAVKAFSPKQRFPKSGVLQNQKIPISNLHSDQSVREWSIYMTMLFKISLLAINC